MASPIGGVVYVKSWVTVGAGNLFVSLASSALYLAYFWGQYSLGNRSTQGVGDDILCCVSALLAINFCTIFFYIFEHSFRLLFRAQLDVEMVLRPSYV